MTTRIALAVLRLVIRFVLVVWWLPSILLAGVTMAGLMCRLLYMRARPVKADMPAIAAPLSRVGGLLLSIAPRPPPQ